MSDWPSIAAIADDVNNQKTTALSQVKKALDKVEEYSQYDAVISTLKERALERAKEIDEKIKSGKSGGNLAGVPFVAKDNFLTFGSNTTASSNMLKDFKAPYQATAINLLEEEGAICIAKTNLDAFAHGASTENSDFMVTKNPHDKTRVPGGSSGGSTASVALGIAPFGLGTDTGGSIRMPSSLCGVIGYKPTYGLVSRSGVVAMSSSLDTIGVMTNTTDDLAAVMEVLAKVDPLDSTTIKVDETDFTNEHPLKKNIKIGVIKEYFESITDKSIDKDIKEAIDRLEKEGFEISYVNLPSFPLAVATYYVLCPAEVSSNLSRYDGLKFGYHSKSGDIEESRSEGFGAEAKRRIIIGTYVLSSGYYDAYYKQAQLVRTKIINEFNEAFKKVDFLLAPTTATRAFKIGEKAKDPLSMYLTDIMTVPANLSGMPAINLPVRTSEKLPAGLQLMAPQRQDLDLISLSRNVEKVVG